MNWQPIETAPKDGTIILGCEWFNRPAGEHVVAEMSWQPYKFRTGWFLESTYWPDESASCNPTHWMPRPEAPE